MVDYLHSQSMVQVAEETNFAVDPAAGYFYLPITGRVDTSGLRQLMFDDETVLQDVYVRPKLPARTGRCEGDVTIESYVYGYNPTIPTAAPSAAHALSKMFAAVMGGLMLGGYEAGGTSSSTTTIIKVTSGASFTAGQFVVTDIGVAPATDYVGRFIQEVDLTPTPKELCLATDMDLSVAPEDSKSVWGSINCFHLKSFPAARKSFSIRITTEAEQITLLGCRGRSWQMSGQNGGLVKVTFVFAVSGIAVSTSPSLSVQTCTDPDPIDFVDALFRITDTSTSHDLDVESFTASYDSGLLTKTDPTHSAGKGRKEWAKGAGPGMSLEINPKFQTDWRDWHVGQDGLYVECNWGTQPGDMCAFRLPGTFISDMSPDTEVDGQIASSMQFGMNRYTGDTDSATSEGDDNTIDKYATVSFG